MERVRFKRIKNKERSMTVKASVPIAKGVYLSGWLIKDNGEDININAPSGYVATNSKKQIQYRDIVYFKDNQLKNRWLNRIKEQYLSWKECENLLLLKNRLALFKEIFKGRNDVFAKYWESSGGKKGFQPACKNEWKKGICSKPCLNCLNKEYFPLTDDIYKLHLNGQDAKGRFFVVGVYPLLENNTTFFIVADFDGNNSIKYSKEFMEECFSYGIPAYIERSRSGFGCHVWIFFKDKIPAWKSRIVILEILRISNVHNGKAENFDRLFPNQDMLTGKGLGNLIALPLQGQAFKRGNTLFLDPENQLKPFKDQWQFLSKIKKVGEEKFDQLIKDWQLRPNKKKNIHSLKLGSKEALGRVIKKCEFIRYCIENADSLSEPLWYCMISNLAVFEGGEEKIHEYSKPYCEYTWAETEGKIAHALTNTGPHNCQTIRREGFDCPINCDVKSPAGLGYKKGNNRTGG